MADDRKPRTTIQVSRKLSRRIEGLVGRFGRTKAEVIETALDSLSARPPAVAPGASR